MRTAIVEDRSGIVVGQGCGPNRGKLAILFDQVDAAGNDVMEWHPADCDRVTVFAASERATFRVLTGR
ncbi:hypothetical protein [Thalassobacillus pellis]|uniref:hypothetical protein n=1 Tax=Thalassobacillus pellis TaxID=748008 RepID=UPI0019609B58|nr:hypothetical protein [Thalassobacillus pellis]MBM7554526.1 hypothetical protein [Thalassobacillus pellis]